MSRRDVFKWAVARAGRGTSVLRRLPDDLGGLRFPASLEGGAKFLRRDIHRMDPTLTRFAAQYVRPGSVTWDVGANVGLFTFAAAGLAGPAGRVVAIEADIWLAGRLRRAASKNEPRGHVDVLPVAISDSAGVAEFNIAQHNRAVNYLTIGGGAPITGGIREKQHVPTLALDTLLDYFPPPDVLKIDVEGAEPYVLRGGRQVFKTRPVVLMEVRPQDRALVADLLGDLDYSYLDAATGKPVSEPSFNVIAVPR